MSLTKTEAVTAIREVGATTIPVEGPQPATLLSLLGARIENRNGGDLLGYRYGADGIPKAAAARAANVFCWLLTQKLNLGSVQRDQPARENQPARKVVGMALNAQTSVNPTGRGSLGDTVIWLNGPNAVVIAQAFDEVLSERRPKASTAGTTEATPQSRIMGAANMESLATIMADLNMSEALILELDDTVQAAPEGARRGLAFRNARSKAFDAFVLGGVPTSTPAPTQTSTAKHEEVTAPDANADEIPF
jgi:hypothetical protein